MDRLIFGTCVVDMELIIRTLILWNPPPVSRISSSVKQYVNCWYISQRENHTLRSVAMMASDILYSTKPGIGFVTDFSAKM
jgi:hypothetical protein